MFVKNYRVFLAVCMCLALLGGCAKGTESAKGAKGAKSTEDANAHKPGDLIKDSVVALKMLKDGNARYLKGALTDKSTYAADRETLSGGQKPFAVVLTCADSRVAPEIFFDQKLGDIFTIRNAGNVVDTTVLGSIEYAVEHLKSVLVIVSGHSKCGAVTAACSSDDKHPLPPNIESIVARIKPSVQPGRDVEQVVQYNVKHMVEQIKENKIIEELGVKVLGSYYNIQTGAVEWL